VTYTASADAWIDQNSASNNKGDDSTLKLQGKSSNNNMRALVRFNLPTSLPDGCVVQSATLRLYAESVKTGRTLHAFQVNGAWTEMGVTWANQPPTTGTPAATSSNAPSGSAGSKGYRQWVVTSQVQAMLAGTNHGFLIRDSVENQGSHEQQFQSREKNEQRPQLVVTYATGTSGNAATLAGASMAFGDAPATGPSVSIALTDLPREALDTHVVLSVAELYGPEGAVAPYAAQARLNGEAINLDALNAPTARLSLPEGAASGRYTGTITATWFDHAGGEFVTRSFAVDFSIGGYRIHLPLIQQ
jgi:hypothetical protein